MKDMDMAKLVDYARKFCQTKIPVVDGNPFPKRPEGVYTFGQWLSRGYKPKNIAIDGKVFQTKDFQGNAIGYTYFERDDVVELTDGERKQLDELGVKHDNIPPSSNSKVFGEESSERQRNRYWRHRYAHEGAGKQNAYQKKMEEESRKKDGQPVNLSKKPYGRTKPLEELPPIPDMRQFTGKKAIGLKIEATSGDPREAEAVRLVLTSLEKGEDGKLKGTVLFQRNIRPIAYMKEEELEKAHITRQELDYAPYPENVKREVERILGGAEKIVVYDKGFHLDIFEKTFGIKIQRDRVVDLQDIYRVHNQDPEPARMGVAIHRYLDKNLANTYDAIHAKGDSRFDAMCLIALYNAMYNVVRKEQELDRRYGRTKDDGDDRER